MSELFKADYLAGKILEYLYSNSDKSFGIDTLFLKFESPNVDINYLKREVEFLVTDELLHKETVGVDMRYNTSIPAYSYRINNKGVLFITNLLKDNKALRNSKIAIGVSIIMPIAIFIINYLMTK